MIHIRYKDDHAAQAILKAAELLPGAKAELGQAGHIMFTIQVGEGVIKNVHAWPTEHVLLDPDANNVESHGEEAYRKRMGLPTIEEELEQTKADLDKAKERTKQVSRRGEYLEEKLKGIQQIVNGTL